MTFITSERCAKKSLTWFPALNYLCKKYLKKHFQAQLLVLCLLSDRQSTSHAPRSLRHRILCFQSTEWLKSTHNTRRRKDCDNMTSSMLFLFIYLSIWSTECPSCATISGTVCISSHDIKQFFFAFMCHTYLYTKFIGHSSCSKSKQTTWQILKNCTAVLQPISMKIWLFLLKMFLKPFFFF